MAQLVRALPSHGRGRRFESFYAHYFEYLNKGKSGQRPKVRVLLRPPKISIQFLVKLAHPAAFGGMAAYQI